MKQEFEILEEMDKFEIDRQEGNHAIEHSCEYGGIIGRDNASSIDQKSKQTIGEKDFEYRNGIDGKILFLRSLRVSLEMIL